MFEQRFSDEQVVAARARIAAGGSLRAAAAEIGCAPSTLSVRISKAEAAEADARLRLGSRERTPARARGAGPSRAGKADRSSPRLLGLAADVRNV